MNVRTHTTLVGVFPVIPYLDTVRGSEVGPHVTQFAGRFTLPFEAVWGEMVLSEGEYSLYYGVLREGTYYVEIHGTGQGSLNGFFLFQQPCLATVVQNSLVCIHKGSKHIIRALELPAIGKSVSFAGPNSWKSIKEQEISEATCPSGVVV